MKRCIFDKIILVKIYGSIGAIQKEISEVIRRDTKYNSTLLPTEGGFFSKQTNRRNFYFPFV